MPQPIDAVAPLSCADEVTHNCSVMLHKRTVHNKRMARNKPKSIHSKPLVWFSLIAIVLVNLAGVQQAGHAQGAVCMAAVNQGKHRIAQVRQTEVVSVNRWRHTYPDGPRERPFAYHFVISGAGTEDVMTSPVFLKSISNQITASCTDVSMVHFGVDQTDWDVRFGLVTQLTPFKCTDPETRTPQWGETVCP